MRKRSLSLLLATSLISACSSGVPLHVRGCDGSELPLRQYERPANERAAVLFLTGDGGWRALDRDISSALAREDFGVTGFLADDYYDTPRTLAASACDLGRAISETVRRSHGEKLLLIGFSRGAETIAAALPLLDAATRSEVRLAVLLAPDRSVSMQRGFFGRAKLNSPIDARALPAGVPMLCFHGTRERDTLCNLLPGVENVAWPGGHHFNGDYRAIAARIVRRWRG